MKRTLILLSLFAVPGMLTSCKDEAATPAPVNTATVAEVTKSAPEPAAEVSRVTTMPAIIDRNIEDLSEESKNAFRVGYEGNTAELDNLKTRDVISDYCEGAAAAGRTELVLQCLEKGANRNWGLYGAALGGHINIVQLLIEKGASNYNVGLRMAASAGHIDIVKLMLEKGANPDWGLAGATFGGHMDIVKLVLEKAPDPYWGFYGAAYGGHMDIVQLMLEKGTTDNDDEDFESLGFTEITSLVFFEHFINLSFMIEKGATVYDGGLLGAARGGHMDIVQLMLEKGATDYNEGLKSAALGGHIAIVQLMLEKGATDYIEGLRMAAKSGHIAIVQLMLEKGVDPKYGLVIAAYFGHMDIVQLLLEKGATYYDDVLMMAAQGGHMDIVQLLLENGATDYGEGLYGAALGGHMDIVQLMLEKGADPNKGLNDTIRNGHTEMLKLLLAQPGIDVNRKDENGKTPLDYAEENGHTECADLLRAAGAE